MKDYMTAKEAALKWGVSIRRIQVFCVEGRIPGAIKYANVWAIPKDTKKPDKLRSGPKPKKKRDFLSDINE